MDNLPNWVCYTWQMEIWKTPGISQNMTQKDKRANMRKSRYLQCQELANGNSRSIRQRLQKGGDNQRHNTRKLCITEGRTWVFRFKRPTKWWAVWMKKKGKEKPI